MDDMGNTSDLGLRYGLGGLSHLQLRRVKSGEMGLSVFVWAVCPGTGVLRIPAIMTADSGRS